MATWLLVGKAMFVSVGIYHARASLSHRSPRCPGESDFQVACCFQTWSTASVRGACPGAHVRGRLSGLVHFRTSVDKTTTSDRHQIRVWV